MPYYDEIFKHVTGEFPQDLAVLALKTSEVEVGERLSTEQATVRVHHSDMTFHVRLPDEEAIMQEFPFYEQVIQRGIEQGARQTSIENTLAVLKARFPNTDVNTIRQRLEVITDINQLKQVSLNASLAASFHDFQETLADCLS